MREGRPEAGDVVVVTLLVYIAVVTGMRFFWFFSPWAVEGDWKQWIWEYQRYSLPGAFPPGHVLTEYLFKVQPPLYYAVFAAMSHVVHPGVAARILSVIAYAGAVGGVYRATTRLSHWAIGLAAAVFLVHDYSFFHQTMGGYPRSFGPTLVLLFLDAWIARRHTAVLVLIVLMGAIYPSVLPSCGLAYGVSVVLDIDVTPRTWLLRVLSTTAAGAVASASGVMQNLLAPKWWGPVISAAEAESMAALHAGGRMRWLPLGNYWPHLPNYGLQPFEPAGALDFFHLLPWSENVPRALGGLVMLVLAAVVLAKRRRFPWEVLGLAVSAAIAYFAARELAFQMYLPHRVVQHTLPYCTMVAFPALAYQAFTVRWPASVKAVRAALATVLVPLFVLSGDGFLVLAWGHDEAPRPVVEFLRAHTPVTAQIAGDLDDCDMIPYFAARQVYANRTTAHPFRLGYWDEIMRRLVREHDAMFASDTDTVIRFVEEEKIDYFILERSQFVQLDDKAIFHPLKSFVTAIWQARKPKGFVLATPPADAVVYGDDKTVIIDAKKLVQLWRGAPAPARAAGPAAAAAAAAPPNPASP